MFLHVLRRATGSKPSKAKEHSNRKLIFKDLKDPFRCNEKEINLFGEALRLLSRQYEDTDLDFFSREELESQIS